MEITINIPKNDYVQPTEVRQEIVQAICITFLETHVNSIFHPFYDGPGRYPTLYVDTKNKRGGFNKNKEDGVRVNGAEMKAAFKALREAGYHIFKIYEYRSWMGYECSKKPFMQDGTEVTEFTDFID